MPATATCSVDGAGGATANIVYPADWYTIDSPSGMACRYFDPAPITVPDDPLTLETAVMLMLEANVVYDDAIRAATDEASWSVTTETAYTIMGRPATLIEATSTDATSGYAVGTVRYAYIVDLVANGTGFIQTTGSPGDALDASVTTVDVIASTSVISAPF
jgi:hypothetical protein